MSINIIKRSTSKSRSSKSGSRSSSFEQNKSNRSSSSKKSNKKSPSLTSNSSVSLNRINDRFIVRNPESADDESTYSVSRRPDNKITQVNRNFKRK